MKLQKTVKLGFIVIGALIIMTMSIAVINDFKISTVENCKIKKLQSFQILSNESNQADYRYLIITDKETFICTSSLVNSKFNNSDIFWRLKEDSTYTFKVCGFGKSMITDYRNILDVL